MGDFGDVDNLQKISIQPPLEKIPFLKKEKKRREIILWNSLFSYINDANWTRPGGNKGCRHLDDEFRSRKSKKCNYASTKFQAALRTCLVTNSVWELLLKPVCRELLDE
jgi:hypothetical protein